MRQKMPEAASVSETSARSDAVVLREVSFSYDGRPALMTLLLAVAISSAVAALVIEPATTRAAFPAAR